MKFKALYFVTERLCKLKKVKPLKERGLFKVGDKSFAIDAEVKPLFIEEKSHLFWRKLTPLYIVHGDKHPASYNLTFKIAGNPNPKANAELIPNPVNMSSVVTQSALRELLKPSGMHKKDVMMWLVLGGMLGTMFGYILAGMW